MPPINLDKTQTGYVPLKYRFKSMPADWKSSPRTAQQLYFNLYANQTLEHATIDLLYPPPKWLTLERQYRGLQFAYRRTDNPNVLRKTSNGKIRTVRLK